MNRRSLARSTLLLLITMAPGRAQADEPMAEPSDAELATFVNELAPILIGAVADKPSDPASSALCQPPSPDAATLAEFQAFGTPGEVMMSIIELGALADAEADPLYVSASAIVFPDGRVRWYEMTVVPWTFGEHQARMRSRGAAVPAAAPQLAAAVAQLVEALAQPGCPLSPLTVEDMAALPEPFRVVPEGLERRLRRACDAAAGDAGGWAPQIGTLDVVLQVGETYVKLGTMLEVEDGRLRMVSVNMREVRP